MEQWERLSIKSKLRLKLKCQMGNSDHESLGLLRYNKKNVLHAEDIKNSTNAARSLRLLLTPRCCCCQSLCLLALQSYHFALKTDDIRGKTNFLKSTSLWQAENKRSKQQRMSFDLFQQLSESNTYSAAACRKSPGLYRNLLFARPPGFSHVWGCTPPMCSALPTDCWSFYLSTCSFPVETLMQYRSSAKVFLSSFLHPACYILSPAITNTWRCDRRPSSQMPVRGTVKLLSISATEHYL